MSLMDRAAMQIPEKSGMFTGMLAISQLMHIQTTYIKAAC
jgi:hypothetical protein